MFGPAKFSFGHVFAIAAPWLLGCLLLLNHLRAQETLVNEAPKVSQAGATGDRIDPRSWMPETSVLYAEIAPAGLWLDHPMRGWLTSTDAFKTIWRSPEVLKARGGIFVAELAIGMKLEDIARELSEGGAYIVIDKRTDGMALLTKTSSAAWLKKYLDKLLEVARSDAKSKGQPDPVKSAEYRGVQGYQFQNVIFGSIDEWLLVTNRSPLAQAIIDRQQDASIPNLLNARWLDGFQGINASGESGSTTRVIAVQTDLEQIRQLDRGNDLFKDQAKDFGAELILGGVLSVLRHAPSASGSIEFRENGVTGELSAPTDPAWFGKSREHFVGPNQSGRAPAPLLVANSIGTLSAYRNLSEMWLRAGDLFDQNVNDQLAQADNTLTTLFSGKDFGTDILGAIEPEVQVIAVPQTFADGALSPSVKLPSFALVARLKKPEVMQKELKRTFQSFLGFLNVVGAMEGQPQIDQNMDLVNGQPLFWGEYVPDSERKYENGLPIQFNFSPAIAFVGDHVVLASHVALARQLAEKPWTSSSADSTSSDANSFLNIDFQALRQVLESNENALITQNMLEKGHSKEEATKEVGMLMSILSLLKEGSLRLSFDDRTKLELRIDAMEP